MAKSKTNARIDRKEKKVKITFVDDVKIHDHNNEVSFEAKRGDVVSVVVSSARFHIVRDSAVEGDHSEEIQAEDQALEGTEGEGTEGEGTEGEGTEGEGTEGEGTEGEGTEGEGTEGEAAK